MKPNHIVICGGHFSPAVAVIEILRKNKNYSLYFVGRKTGIEGDETYSLEYQTMIKWKIPFYSITTGRLQRSFTHYTLPSLFKLPIGFLQSLYFLVKIKPKLVLAFGGYVALPLCLAAYLLKIPIIIHEQTPVLGLTNRIIARLARTVCLSYRETKCIPPKVETLVTGIPIRKAIFSRKVSPLCDFGNNNLPLLYITGGSLGARTINEKMAKVIPSLLKKFRILHQCGSVAKEEDYKKLSKLKNSLPKEIGINYRVVKYIDPFKIGGILHKTQLVISRAGANTVAELAALGVPAILIPLPWAADDEQEQNARLLQKIGLVKIISQEDATSENLIDTIDFMQKNILIFKNASKISKKHYSPKTASQIVELVDSIVKNVTKPQVLDCNNNVI